MQRIQGILATVLLISGMTIGPVKASPADLAQGIQAYKMRQYNAAVGALSRAAQSNPNDPMVHYYLGLAYQGLNQMSLAKQQYQWVASCSNPALRANASAALANLSHYQTTWSSANSQIAMASPSASHSGGSKLSGRLKLMDFYADW